MTTLIELAYLWYYCWTFFTSCDDGRVYRRRMCATFAMLWFLCMVGHTESRELAPGLAGAAVAFELFFFVVNFLDYDDRIFQWRTP